MIDAILDGLARSTLALTISAAVAVILLAALRPRSPRLHHLVWFVVLLQAFCWRPFALPVLPPPTETSAALETANPSVSILMTDELPFPIPAPSTVAAAPSAVLSGNPPSYVVASVPAASPPWSWRSLAIALWLAGLSLLLLVGLIDYLRLLRRLAREQSPSPEHWLTDWNTLPHARTKLIATDSCGPLAMRTPFASIVAAPRAFLDSLSPTERRAVLAHELAHLRRGDPFWMLVAWLAAALQWFNPFAWLAARRFHAAAELACDARLDDAARLPLAHVLLSLGEPARRPALAMTGGALAARIRALAAPRPHEPRWRSAMIAALVLALFSTAWLRLEAAPAPQPPKDNPPPTSAPKIEPKALKENTAPPSTTPQDPPSKVKKRDIGKKKSATAQRSEDTSPEAIKRMEAELAQKTNEKLAARQAVVQVLKEREDAVASYKAREKTIGASEKSVIEQKMTELGEQAEQRQKSFQKAAAEYDQLKRNLEAMKDDLATEKVKLQLLWDRSLRSTTVPEDDALALERTLNYLAYRGTKFGLNEILPDQEHVETEAVLKLEALIKRGLKPNPGETQRQALERILQTPPTRERQHLVQMRASMKKLECPTPFWDDHRDKWLDFAATVIGNAAELSWPLSEEGHVLNSPAAWRDGCAYMAAVRTKPPKLEGGVGFFMEQFTRSSEPFLPRTILLAETACKANDPHCPETWNVLRQQLAAPQKSRFGDLRNAPIVIDRLFALLTAAKGSTVYAKTADELRQLLEDHLPARALDKIMEREGQNRVARVRHFRDRKVSVNFQGRGFANAFEELTNKAAVPLVVLEPGWRSKLTPVTLHADARWIDVLKEVTRQVGLAVTDSPQLLVVHHINDDNPRLLIEAAQRAVPRRRRPADPSPPYPSSKLMEALAGPATMQFSETPLKQGLQFMETQCQVPLVLFLPNNVDADTPITIEANDIPLSVALELLIAPLHMTWIPIYDSVLLAPAPLKADLEAKATLFRDQRKALEAAASTGDPAAKALMAGLAFDFNGTPLDQGIQFFKVQQPGLQLETRVANKDLPITISVSGVYLAETLALIAMKHNLKLTFEGAKAVLSDN